MSPSQLNYQLDMAMARKDRLLQETGVDIPDQAYAADYEDESEMGEERDDVYMMTEVP